MAGSKIETNYVVNMASKGAAKLRTEAERINSSIKKGADDAKKGYKEATKEITSFEKAMGSAIKEMGGNKAAEKALRAVGSEFGKLQKQVDKLTESMKKATAAKGAFLQGLAQGMGAGEFLQRGPGMAKQVAGRTIGQAVMAPGHLARGAMFGGASGFASALSSIPGGGLLGQPLQQAIGMAGGALSFQKQQLSSLPYLMQRGTGSAVSAARAATAPGMLSAAEIETQAKAARPTVTQAKKASFRKGLRDQLLNNDAGMPGSPIPSIAAVSADAAAGYDQKKADLIGDKIVAEKRKELTNRNIGLQRENTRRVMEKSVFGGITSAGSEFGYSKAESMQMATQMAQRGGGAPSANAVKTAMAAQRRYGVSMDTAGSFQLAQRQGGIAGGTGMVGAINQAKRMGLEGSEVTDYLQEIAQGISNFQQTGIPINPRSITGLARSVAVTGVGIARGRKIAASMVGAGQQLSKTGPQSGVDMLMYQAAGYKGGGLEDLLQADLALEKGLDPDQMMGVMKKIAKAGGGGASSVYALQRGLAGKGVDISKSESLALVNKFQNKSLSKGDAARVKDIKARMASGGLDAPGSAGDLQAMAKGLTSALAPHVIRQAEMVDKQLEAGQKLLDAVLKMDFASIGMAATTATALAPTLDWLAGSASDLSKDLEKFVNLVKERGLSGAIATTWAANVVD